MRSSIELLLLTALTAVGVSAQTAPVRSPLRNIVIPPAISNDGGVIGFASTMAPDGSETRSVADLYVYARGDLKQLTHLPATATPLGPPRGVSSVTLAPAGDLAAYTTWSATTPDEEVHVINVTTGADVTAAVYKKRCIQPACIECAVACLRSAHLTPDGSMVLYAGTDTEPFYLAKADGTGVAHSAGLHGLARPVTAARHQHAGRAVFTSSAPFGPTLAPQATDVYTMTIDGADITQVTNFGNNASIVSQDATITADGSLIAFASNFDPVTASAGQTQIWVAKADGSAVTRLTSGDEPATNPSISADGRFIAFTRGGQLHIFNTADVIFDITNYQNSEASAPDLSGDGMWAAYALGPKSAGQAAIHARNVQTHDEQVVFAPRMLNAEGVTSAGGGAEPASRGIASVYGVNLITEDRIVSSDSFPLPTSLEGVSVLVNGEPAPLLAITPWQINLQVPALPEANATFQIRGADEVLSNTVEAAVKNASPAPFVVLECGEVVDLLAGNGRACRHGSSRRHDASRRRRRDFGGLRHGTGRYESGGSDWRCGAG